MSDDIEFQTYICPTCKDDHSINSKCKVSDLILIPEIKTELEIKNEKINKLESKLEKCKEALDKINNIAPPMYKYSEVEMEIVVTAREALKEVFEDE